VNHNRGKLSLESEPQDANNRCFERTMQTEDSVEGSEPGRQNNRRVE